MLSVLFPNMYAKSSDVRVKYGTARIVCILKYDDSTWILQNFDTLTHGDIALLSEYAKDITLRKKCLDLLFSI